MVLIPLGLVGHTNRYLFLSSYNHLNLRCHVSSLGDIDLSPRKLRCKLPGAEASLRTINETRGNKIETVVSVMSLARADGGRVPHTEPSDQHEPRPLSLDRVRKTQVQIKTVDSDKCGLENP